jgi:hypothetical protein
MITSQPVCISTFPPEACPGDVAPVSRRMRLRRVCLTFRTWLNIVSPCSLR